MSVMSNAMHCPVHTYSASLRALLSICFCHACTLQSLSDAEAGHIVSKARTIADLVARVSGEVSSSGLVGGVAAMAAVVGTVPASTVALVMSSTLEVVQHLPYAGPAIKCIAALVKLYSDSAEVDTSCRQVSFTYAGCDPCITPN